MTTLTEAIEPAVPVPRRSARVVAAVIAIGAVVLAASGASAHGDDLAWAAFVLVAAWALAAVGVAAGRPAEPMWMWLAGAAVVGGLSLRTAHLVGLVPWAAAVVAIVLPDGIVARGATRNALVLCAVAGLPCTIALAAQSKPAPGLVAVESTVLAFVAVVTYTLRCRRAGAVERARLQWAGWGVVVAGACALVLWLMHALIGWPDATRLGTPIVIATVFVPLAIALSAFDRVVMHIDRLLVRTIEAGGLVVLVGVVYVVVVLGFGDTPTDATRRVLGLSIVAAAIAALLFVPARNWLEELANRRVYGELRAPDEPLQTFGARMSRAIPLDELLLQLAESLKKSMQLALSEVWTGADGVLELAASVPYRETGRVRLNDEEAAVVARAHVSGNAWIQVWLPDLLAQHPGQTLRMVPLVHSGELLGVIVCGRTADQQPFTDEEERMLNDLARQVALALHNSALDTALQASLDELKIANEELRQSRARIVAASDQSRRQIERNLHDGAQQHLVALAVKLGLARQLVEADPQSAATLLEELRADAQTTLTELRELAHGIYPPLLMDRGLSEALVAAANRSTLATEVHADVGRFPSEIEAAVYFCCLEALQNAGKHAGAGAHVDITVTATDHELSFTVVDNGAGFDATGDALRGHGFINMADRLGAIGGRLEIDSGAGRGTRIGGVIPLVVHELDSRPSHS